MLIRVTTVQVSDTTKMKVAIQLANKIFFNNLLYYYWQYAFKSSV